MTKAQGVSELVTGYSLVVIRLGKNIIFPVLNPVPPTYLVAGKDRQTPSLRVHIYRHQRTWNNQQICLGRIGY